MTIKSSGSLAMSEINAEFGRGNNLNSYRGTTWYTDAGGSGTFSSGAIAMSEFYGKRLTAPRVAASYTFSANTANASLNITTISGYSAGKTDVTIYVNSGVYLYATSTANAGLTLTGGTAGDTVKLVNNGYIMGQGGVGGYLAAGGSGGPALSLGFDTTVDNTNASAYIGGGGGGGGGGSTSATGGGGAGGGAGGTYNSVAGGSGGGVGSTGGTGSTGGGSATGGGGGGAGGGGGGIGLSGKTYVASTGGGGGRIFPGVGGAGSTNPNNQSTGGAGGSANAAGGVGGNLNTRPGAGGGGGWGANGGANGSGVSAGGAGGKAAALNGKTITWVSGVTTRVYGAVS